MDLTATVYWPPQAKSPWTLEQVYSPSILRYYSYGRHALLEALKIAGVHGQRVLLPSLICRDVLASVHAAGADVSYYSVNADLTPSDDPSRWPDARAVLAVNYFGFPQDLSPFEVYTRRNGATVIEDAAHALFSRDARGRLLGTRTPLGVLSLRKSLPLPNGGALIANDPAFVARLPSPLAFQKVPGRRAAWKAGARPLLALSGARAALTALTGLRFLRGDASGHVGPDPDSEKNLPDNPHPCLQLERPLRCADPEIEASRRRALWSYCDGLARRSGLTPVFNSLPEGTVPYGYAFRTNNFSSSRSIFSAVGLTTLPWPDLPTATIESAPEQDKNIALVHFLW
jgi:hypothetical protein